MTCGDKCDKSCKRCLKLAKKYINKKCVLLLTIVDIPKTIITNTTFSFSDIANDVLRIEERALSNKVIQQFVKDPLIYDPVLVARANRVLTNICLNVVNDPMTPPPPGFIKRAIIVSTDGNVIVDVNTYKDDPEGIANGLNKDKNVINMSTYHNILDKPQNPLNQPIYSDNLSFPKTNLFLTQDMYFNSNNIDPKALATLTPGLKTSEINVLFFSNRTYTYPADEINPSPTGGVASNFQIVSNHGVREEIQEARIQDWGYASRRSPTLNQLPAYYVAHHTNLDNDGYSITLRVSYVKYK